MIYVMSAPKRSGKDVIADILKKHHEFQRVAFADPLRKLCAEVFEMSEDFFFDDKLKDLKFPQPIVMRITEVERLCDLVNANEMQRELLFRHGRDLKFYTPREILQIVGTDLVRNCVNDNYWVDLGVTTIKNMDGRVVVTDARLPNERAALKAIGAVLIRVKRNGYEGEGHVSETSLGEDRDYDVIINNNGTLTELEHDVLQWFRLRNG